ncbi:IPTL-CTERM sorting domain-containing protein [Diaphorobacter aerolatus]|uniref:IPTL-CTERM sorting domain-containing protein n=1 Tax=Diaphorobacter aerolatus TaxID=1288495 RepID=A0A7H0GLH0_9BURK|nr:IPTL-CTERM sorting domain-containing protein [Diaphorobacter aerolatus]QNP49136.1 IPTL-CTERM sorting domain-containing protein [Diaphorobacter aerolatus]
MSFPHGLFDFVLEGGTPGSAAEVHVTYPATLPSGAVYWKYGPTPSGLGCSSASECAAPHWYAFPGANIVGNTVRLTIVDGGPGDDDLSANGVIIDAGGPGVVGTVDAPGAVAVPTLSQWALFIMMLALAFSAVRVLRGRRSTERS